MLPREVRDSGWAKKYPKVEVDRLPRFDELVPSLANIPPVVNSGGQDILRTIFKNDLFPTMSISKQHSVKSLRVCIYIWIGLDIYIALLLVVTAEVGFANLEVFDSTFGTGSCTQVFDSIVMCWGRNASNKIMINVDIVKVRYLVIHTQLSPNLNKPY
jgi:hypothetical protein